MQRTDADLKKRLGLHCSLDRHNDLHFTVAEKDGDGSWLWSQKRSWFDDYWPSLVDGVARGCHTFAEYSGMQDDDSCDI